MDFELISSEAFDSLPEDDEQCFVEFESICRASVNRILDDEKSGDFFVLVRSQYMATVYAVAQECGLTNIPSPQTTDDFRENYEVFSRFSSAVLGEVARIRLRGRRGRGSLSVQLTDNARTKIQHYVSRLREAIDASGLPSARIAALHDKLNELMGELEKRRLNLGKAMVVLSVVVANLAGATTIAAEGPTAVTHIMRLIGVDKESEEVALSRLAPPPKALPAPPQKAASKRKKPAPSWEPARGGDLDDDIPF